MAGRTLGGGSRGRVVVASCVTVGVLAASFVGLAALVWETNRVVGLDRAAERLLQAGGVDSLFASGSPGSDSPLRAEEVVRLGDRTAVVFVAVCLAALALLWRDRVGAIVAVAGPGLTGGLTEYVIKPLVNVPSPVGARTYPSGHAGGATAIALVAVIVVYRRWGRAPGLVLAPAAGGFAVLVCAALLRLDFHYPSDVLGGAILAALVVVGLTASLSLYRGPGHRLLGRPGEVPPDAPLRSAKGRGRSDTEGDLNWPRRVEHG